MSGLQPYQQRVIDEKAELEKKAKALSEFIGTNPLFEKLDTIDQELMRAQCELMWQYFTVLEKRIERFGVSCKSQASGLDQLFHVQDPDRPAFVIADSFEHALAKWKAVVAFENEGADMPPPQGVMHVCSAEELIIDVVSNC